MQSSNIFRSTPEKKVVHKTYEWSQQKSSVGFSQDDSTANQEAPNRKDKDSVDNCGGNGTATKTSKSWPWQEKAKTSNIFDTPENTKQTNYVYKYTWDQTQSGFDMMGYGDQTKGEVAPTTRVRLGLAEKLDANTMVPAGRRCYGDVGFQRGSTIGNPVMEAKAKVNEEDAET